MRWELTESIDVGTGDFIIKLLINGNKDDYERNIKRHKNDECMDEFTIYLRTKQKICSSTCPLSVKGELNDK